jgi:cell division transport system permease protein
MNVLYPLFSQTGRNFRKTWPTQLFTFLAVSLSILIFSFFFLIYLNITKAGQSLGSELRLTLYFEDELVEPLQEQLRYRINDFSPVEKIVYVGREEALARLSHLLGDEKDILDGLDSSFLPASLEIYPQRNLQSLSRIKTFADYLATLPGVQKVQYGQEWLQRLAVMSSLIHIIILLSGSLVILTTIFMISQTIRLTMVARKDELEILCLLGADRSYIQGPLILEGFLQGLLGSGLGVFLLYLLFEWATAQLDGFGLLGEGYEIWFFPPLVLTGIVVAAVVLCLAGCLLSTRKILRI